jgi:multicomponent Na+:H+ antiporter subunit G
MLLALAVHSDDPAITLRALAGILFFLLTVPISSHLLAKAAHGAGYRLWEGSVRDDLQRFDDGSEVSQLSQPTQKPAGMT